MELQGRDLQFGLQGDDVGLLQRELGQLDLGTPPIPEGETQGQQFDDGTRRAVVAFQLKFNISPSGIVDADTARAINAEVDRLQSGQFIVRGHIRYSDRPYVGLVKVFENTSWLLRLGLDVRPHVCVERSLMSS